jgi:tetratricopeptide (TPR) repeat protein
MKNTEEAIRLHQTGDLLNAKMLYELELQSDPANEICLNNLASLEAEIGNTRLAIQYYKKLLVIKPLNLKALIAIAYSYQLLNENSNAKSFYLKALNLDPFNFNILTNFGLFLKHSKQFKEAKEIFFKALDIEPNNIQLLNNLGNLLSDLGELDQALKLFNQAIVLDETNPILLNNVAKIYSEKYQHKQALKYYDFALQINPSYSRAWAGKGSVLRDLGMVDDAIICFQKAVDIEPESLIARINLTGAYIASSNPDSQKIAEAEKTLRLQLHQTYSNPSVSTNKTAFSFFAFKHHLEQAKYLIANQHPLPGIEKFVAFADEIIEDASANLHSKILISSNDYLKIYDYLSSYHIYKPKEIATAGLNPNNDWAGFEKHYFDNPHQIIYIDNLLSEEALKSLYRYCLFSKVWLTEYENAYLGAFAYSGFISKLHLQIADDFRKKMPRVFGEFKLSHLWAFKYDSVLGTGINVHADPAKVNVNFWLTPDQFNLEPNCGGLKVYRKKSPENWTFSEYNNSKERIYKFLDSDSLGNETIPYRCNRAVIFNSSLFHETDKINFVDTYEGRRINMTYLFGQK